MQSRPLAVDGAWELIPQVHRDERGAFLEVFKDAALEAVTGRAFTIAQVNTSVSAAGVVRGIHFTDAPPGQAKYLTCTRGAVLDVVVDLRVGSPTFGAWDAVRLDHVERRAVFISEGLGHGFCALTAEATVSYLCSTPYAPAREHAIDPFDPDLAIDWPTLGADGSELEWLTSPRDAAAPTLAEAREAGILPRLADVEAHWASLGVG